MTYDVVGRLAIMPTLRIEHAVPSFEMWKRAFDSDPADRKGSGVVRYRISRGMTDPNFVTIDLDFTSLAEAQALLESMEGIWAGPGRAVMVDPRARIVEAVEDVTL